MGKHLVIAGHGRRKDNSFDPGATGLISKGEHRYVKEDLFPTMKKHLPNNHDVIFFDDYNVYDYGNIVALANKYNADQITEVHFDAGDSSASGGHVIIHKDYLPDKMDLDLRDAIDDMVGVRYSHKGFSGISGRDDLGNLNRTASAGVTYRLIELGFGTNKKDAAVMTDDVDEYARALVSAITGKTVETAVFKKEEENDMPDMLNPTEHALNKAVQGVLYEWEQDDNQPLSSQWREKFEKRELTKSDAIGLIFIGIERGYIKG